ncbi:MAG: glycosyltransferase, partial [Actinobacteria bacterium]|nr:glycosyltransferase [Actinomycetota bacterium]
RGIATVVPSVWPEPFAMVIIEAMVAGRPVIGSNIGGIPEAIIDGDNGLIVPPNDAAALRRALERLWMDTTLRGQLAKNAAARGENYRPHAVVPRFERIYADLLA